MRYPTSEGNARGRLVRWLGTPLATAGGRLFAAADAAAARHGWQVTVRRGGLARGYRGPRFATLRGCPLCRGDGRDGAAPCTGCRGTGRVALSGQASAAEGAPR